MSDGSFQRARRVFEAAMELPPPQRDALVQGRCGGDIDLLAYVRGMLEADERADRGGFLSDLTARDPAAISPLAEGPGTRIGPYTLLEQIGEGGFGVVFLAEQREPVARTVALKIIKLGMDTRQVIARFEAERRALALMDHPNIARVLDAGATATGRPYFVMELVRGEAITAHCDKNHLSIHDRLELFTDVCGAVQHAHTKGVIHRDLKPSNVLVTVFDGRATPKVIDFGIAKATVARLTEKTLFTEHRALLGTPQYMSPEQAGMGGAGGEDIDTRSDIYSLGVLLYELLTGATPFDERRLRSAAFGEIQRIIREEEPAKPSTRLTALESLVGVAACRRTEPRRLGALVRGDLDWIVMKCLEKDRGRRYETANSLADDVRNCLAGRPVLAGPQSVSYRLAKFVRRHRGPVAAGVMVFTAFLIGLAGTLWEARRATDRAGAAQTALKTIEHNSYTSNIQMAQAALDFGMFDRVRQRLDACPTALRGWEWRWLNSSIENSLIELRHPDRVFTAVFSPDGHRILTASGDNRARVWDAGTGATLVTFAGHEDKVVSAAFSPDGARVVTASCDNTARVWDAGAGTTVSRLVGHTGCVLAAAFSPDGARVVTASEDMTARVWDATSGAMVLPLTGHARAVTAAAFSPDGARIVTGSRDLTARVWDSATGMPLAQLLGHTDLLKSVAFSPDGTRIVTSSYDHTARVWDAATGSPLAKPMEHTKAVNCAAFSADGARIVTASTDGTVRVWDASTSTMVREFRNTAPVDWAAFRPDGGRIVSASDDDIVRVWDATSEPGNAELKGHTDCVTSAAFSPDGTRVVTASFDNTARVWDAVSGRAILKLAGHVGYVSSAAYSPDGARIITASWDNTVRVWDAATGSPLGNPMVYPAVVISAAFSPDGRRIATACYDSIARVLDAQSGALLAELAGHTGFVTSAAFSPDGARVVTGSRDGTARIWDALSGKVLATLSPHRGYINSAVFSPDGRRIVAASGVHTAIVWDASSGAVILELKGHAADVLAAVFSPDGQRIVTASTDGTARLWDASTGEFLVEFKGHTGFVNTTAFSGNGDRIVTASNDSTARVWDAVPLRERMPAVQEARAAGTTMRARLGQALAAGRSLDHVFSDSTQDAALTLSERMSLQEAVLDERERAGAPAETARSEAVRLDDGARSMVLFRPVPPGWAEQAVRDTRHAVELVPGDPWLLRTLGIALYRAGKFEDSLAVLRRSQDLFTRDHSIYPGGPRPANCAFIAMDLARLGRSEEARETLKQLREAAAKKTWARDEDTMVFLREATETVTASGPPDRK
jgi:WD40 repeat protein/serine/threonine protein kinase